MSNRENTPTPPEGLPNEFVEELNDLNGDGLRKAIIHAQELLDEEAEHSSIIEAKPGEDIIDITEHTGYTEVVKRVPCGEDCSECPHGPYLYHVKEETRPDGEMSLHWDCHRGSRVLRRSCLRCLGGRIDLREDGWIQSSRRSIPKRRRLR